MNKPSINEIIDIINSCSEDVKITENDKEKSLNELGIDSIDFISVIVKLEETFGFEFPDEKLTMLEIDSVSKIVALIDKLLEGKNV